ncbi:MAG: hypothetical protein QM617_07225 [Comamonas sp.]
MYLVLLRFSDNRSQSGPWMQAHQAWLQQGFDDAVFVLAGSLGGQAGGAILAQGIARTALEERVQADPFVIADVVRAEIIEITPSRTDARLDFLRH